MTRILSGAALALALIAGAAMPGAAQENERYVYVTVLGGDGAPLEGLTAEHFAVRESGRDRPVVRVERLDIPMHVAVLVDTSGQQGAPDESYRSAIAELVTRLATSHQVALYSFGDRAVPVLGFTQDADRLRAATAGMFGASHQRSQLVDAVDRALRDLAGTEAKRPVIIAIASESPESSSRTAGGVVRKMVDQSVALHVVSVASATGSGAASSLSNDIPTSSRRLGGVVSAGEGDRERTQMVEQGTAVTGGGRQRVTSSLALASALERVRRELATSYLVTFTRSGSGRVRDLQVGVMVDDVTLRATAAPHGTR
jgi:VWFA-related protein